MAEPSHVRNMEPGVLRVVVDLHALLVYPRQTLQCFVRTGNSGTRSGHRDMDGHVGGAGAGHRALESLFGAAFLVVALIATDNDHADQQEQGRTSGSQAHGRSPWDDADND